MSGAHDAGSGGRVGTKSGNRAASITTKCLGLVRSINFEGPEDPIVTTTVGAFGVVSAPVQPGLSSSFRVATQPTADTAPGTVDAASGLMDPPPGLLAHLPSLATLTRIIPASMHRHRQLQQVRRVVIAVAAQQAMPWPLIRLNHSCHAQGCFAR